MDPFAYQIDLSSNYIDMGTKLRDLWDDLRLDASKRPFLAMSICKDSFCTLSKCSLPMMRHSTIVGLASVSKLEEMGIEIPDER